MYRIYFESYFRSENWNDDEIKDPFSTYATKERFNSFWIVNFSILLKEKKKKKKWIERIRKQRFRNEKSVLLSERTQSFLRDSLRISRRLSHHNFVSSLYVFTEFLARHDGTRGSCAIYTRITK